MNALYSLLTSCVQRLFSKYGVLPRQSSILDIKSAVWSNQSLTENVKSSFPAWINPLFVMIKWQLSFVMTHTWLTRSGSGCCNRQSKTVRINIEITNSLLKFRLKWVKIHFNTKFMLIFKLDYEFRLNLYSEFDISVVDFDISWTPPKIGTNQALKW